MKTFLILSLAAACFAQIPYQGKHVLVRENGITIKSDNGREIDLYKSALYPGHVELHLKTPYAPSRKIQVDQVNNINPSDVEYSHGQYDVLSHLFHPYQGLVDAIRYEELLEKLHKFVQAGYVHETIGDILRHYWTQQSHQYPQAEYEHATPYWQKWNQYIHSPAFQTISPVQRLHFYQQQHQYPQTYYPQTYYPQSHWYKQYEPEHETYQEHRAFPRSGVEVGKWEHPYQYYKWQQQSAWGPWAHQQQYYAGGYQGQQWWNPQQQWNKPYQHQALIEGY
ncbi:unnamed protein product [Phyllotreta striolata]|uniref:Uncharacterized protein n=1 Tax=Phyllotreta striolata TaxID=444603 RepID=A0A9N9TY74_PHYSR|nr:unnamed protein product [Phyllotreta striolata]